MPVRNPAGYLRSKAVNRHLIYSINIPPFFVSKSMVPFQFFNTREGRFRFLSSFPFVNNEFWDFYFHRFVIILLSIKKTPLKIAESHP